MYNNIIQLNQDAIKVELKDLVKNSIEETLNAMLDNETEQLVNAEKYERSSERNGYRAGHYERSYQTTAGDIKLKMPKLKGVQFENRWIKLAEKIPWDYFEAKYASLFPSKTGNVAKPLRMMRTDRSSVGFRRIFRSPDRSVFLIPSSLCASSAVRRRPRQIRMVFPGFGSPLFSGSGSAHSVPSGGK